MVGVCVEGRERSEVGTLYKVSSQIEVAKHVRFIGVDRCCSSVSRCLKVYALSDSNDDVGNGRLE